DIEFDSRIAAFLGRDHERIDAPLRLVSATRARRFAALSTLLWPRGADVRAGELEVPNRFVRLPPPAPAFARTLLGPASPTVRIMSADWRAQVDEALRDFGAVTLDIAGVDRATARAALLDLAIRPTDCGFLFVYPLLESVMTGPRTKLIRLRLRE